MKTIQLLLSKLGTKTFLLLSAFLVVGLVGCSDDDNDGGMGTNDEMNIVETAQSNDDLSILAGAIGDAGLVGTLESGGPFTVFAPTNAAFNELPDGTLENLSQDELAQILTFHVVEGEILSGSLQASQDVETVQGEQLLVTSQGGTVTVNGSSVVATADIEASNGVIHVVDEVLLPQAFREPNIVDQAEELGNFTALTGALEQTGLTTTLQYLGPFTVFAPTDEAFANLPDGLLASLSTDQLTRILQYHVLGAEVFAGDLQPEQSPETILGEDIFITAGDNGAFINGSSEIIATDVDVSNGVIHAIDGVILPNEFLNIVQIAQKDYDLTSLVTALSDAGLVSTLEGDGPFTVFAPTNDAFEAASDLIATLSANEVSEVLQYHAAAQELLAGDLSDGQTITTVQGEDITVNIDGEGNVTLNGSVNVIDVNRQGTNGTVHIIDGVLVPPSFN